MGGVMVDGEQVFQSKDHLTSSSYAGSGEEQATHWQDQGLCRLCRSMKECPATSCWESWRLAKGSGATLQELISTVSLPFSLSPCFLPSLHVPLEPVNIKRPLLPWGMPELQTGGTPRQIWVQQLHRLVQVYACPLPSPLHHSWRQNFGMNDPVICSRWVTSLLHLYVKCLWPLTCSCANALCLQLSHQSYALRPDPCLGL